MRSQVKVTSIILAVIMLTVLSINAFAEVHKPKWEVINWIEPVDAFAGKIDLKEIGIKEDEIIGFDVLEESSRARIYFGLEGSKVTFDNEMKLDTNYALRVITKSNRYEIRFKSSGLRNISENGDAIIVKVPAMPEKGFNWPYYLRIPSNTYKKQNKNSKRYLMIDTPNGGTKDLKSSEKWTIDTLVHSQQYSVQVAEQLWAPILMPAYPVANVYFEHNQGSYMTDEHAFERESSRLHISMQNPKLKELLTKEYQSKGLNVNDYVKLDEQLIAMFDHAVEYLNKYGHNVDTDKMFMCGYSATGTFNDRFTILHPEKVKALVSGATLDNMVVPLKNYKGENLIFPIGIYDYSEISGKDYDIKKHNEVAKLFYMGKDDNNNLVEYGYLDCYSDVEREIIIKLWGYDTLPRAQALTKLYGESGGKGVFILDKDIKHAASKSMIDYVVEFFKANRDTDAPIYPIPNDANQLQYTIFN